MDMDKNVGTIERWITALGGGALLAWGLGNIQRKPPLGAALALGGAALLFRGASGHCPVYEALDMNTADGDGKLFRGKWPLPEGARLVKPGREDVVEEAAEESFPASDPPSFTPSRIG